MSRLYSLTILVLLWAAWCFLHSLLISRGLTARMKKIMGRKYAYYRLAYSLFSLLTLIPVIFYQMHLQEKVIFTWPWPWDFMKYGMYAVAVLLFYGGFRVYDIQYMVGIRQIRQMRQGNGEDTMEFSAEGILGYMRHPWYSGAILLVWAFGVLSDVSLLSKSVLTAYLVIGASLEERKLICEIGEPYRAYRKKVPMFIPWKKNNSPGNGKRI